MMENQVPETQETREVEARLQSASDVAAGRAQADPAETGRRIIGAKKDLNCKGRGPQWYRMVWRDGTWTYVSSDRLPAGSFRAADRRASVHGLVYIGEVVVAHDRGGPIDSACLVCAPDEDGHVLHELGAPTIRRDGQMTITLPDGSQVVRPNPRRR